MKTPYEYLAIAFIANAASAFATKIGATTFDTGLFMLLSYSIGSAFAFWRFARKSEKPGSGVATVSLQFGILTGIINFASYYTFLLALKDGPGALIFPLVGLNVALIFLASIIFFKERPNWKGAVGLILALASLWLLQ